MARTDYVLFRVADVRCALPRSGVRELLPLPELWRPPGAPPMLAGFLNLGGTPVPVVDLARLFGLDRGGEPGLYSHLVVAEGASRGTVAFLVDRVEDVVALDASARPVRDRETLNGSVEGEIEVAGQLVHLLALPRLFLAEEHDRLAALRSAAEDRLADWPAA